MGRTNPRLVPFLRKNLEKQCFINLKYETQECGSENIFYIELPRYDKDKCEEFEKILKAWYEFTGKLKKYISYSKGKSVFQAALKRSVYLISLPNFGKRQRYRFATSDEIKEKKKQLKEKSCNPESPSSYTVTDPPSVASSSGYSSCNDCEGENLQATNENIQNSNMCMEVDCLDDIINFPEKYIGDGYAFDDLFSDININDIKEESSPIIQNINNPQDTVPLQALQSEAFEPVHQISQFMKPVKELKPTPVGNFGTVKKYWLCTQKIKVKGTLQLICEMQVAENENSDMKEGSVVIPKDVFEPGVSYVLNKSFELNDLQYYFFSPNSA